MHATSLRRFLPTLLIGFLAVATGVTISGCSSSAPVASKRVETPPRIDARLTDWDKPADNKDDDVLVRVMNDGEYLYVSMATRDENVIPQVLARGLTVWFDPDGGKEKRFGVTYPRGVAATRNAAGGRGRGGAGRADGAGSAGEPGRPNGARGGRGGGLDEAFRQSLSTVQFMYDGEAGQVYPSDSVPGVELAADVYLNELTIEMKIPLTISSGHQVAIDTQPGATVGVGLVTPDFEAAAASAGAAAGGGGGGRGGGRGGRGGGRGGGGAGPAAAGQGGGLAMKPLKHWVVVELAG